MKNKNMTKEELMAMMDVAIKTLDELSDYVTWAEHTACSVLGLRCNDTEGGHCDECLEAGLWRAATKGVAPDGD